MRIGSVREIKKHEYRVGLTPDCTDSGALPCLKPMSEIAGRLSVQEAAKYLEKTYGGGGVLQAIVTRHLGVTQDFRP